MLASNPAFFQSLVTMYEICRKTAINPRLIKMGSTVSRMFTNSIFFPYKYKTGTRTNKIGWIKGLFSTEKLLVQQISLFLLGRSILSQINGCKITANTVYLSMVKMKNRNEHFLHFFNLYLFPSRNLVNRVQLVQYLILSARMEWWVIFWKSVIQPNDPWLMEGSGYCFGSFPGEKSQPFKRGICLPSLPKCRGLGWRFGWS